MEKKVHQKKEHFELNSAMRYRHMKFDLFGGCGKCCSASNEKFIVVLWHWVFSPLE